MQRGFTKLFNTIVTSTIWREDDKTRIVWITMLAIADAQGIVSASIPGLAGVANVETEACRSAIQKLIDPDPDSRTKDIEGRRIEPIEGGWRILNYLKYRRMLSHEERREYQAKWAKERRRQTSTKRRQTSTNVDKTSTQSTQAEAEAEHSSSSKTQKKNVPPNPLKGDSLAFDSFWSLYPNKQAKPVAKRAWLKLHPSEHQDVMNGLAAWIQSESWTKDNGNYIPHPATFLNQRRWEDAPKTKPPKPDVVYGHPLPPKRIPTDAEFQNARDIAAKEVQKLKAKFKIP